MEITDKNPIDKIGKKGYNIRKSGKADGIMQTGCRTNGYATPCETAFSARACRYAVYGISDTAVAVSVFVFLCLCALLCVVDFAMIGILVIAVAVIVRIIGIIGLIVIDGNGIVFTERKRSRLIP